MKKPFIAIMGLALLSGLLSCDNETTKNSARTDFVFFLNMSDEARDVLEMTWDSKGSSPSLQSFSTGDQGYIPIADDDAIYSGSGHLYVGGFPSFIIAEVGCHVRRAAVEDHPQESYMLSAQLRCTVTTRDAQGQALRTERVECARAFYGLELTREELLSMFGDEEKPYTMCIGIDVENGNSISIFHNDTEEYGTIIKTH